MPQIKSIKAHLTGKNEAFLKSEQLFDINGNLLLTKSFDFSGEFENMVVSTYDSNNRLAEQQNYLTETEPGEKTVIERNDDGYILKEIVEYPDGSQTIKKYTHEKNLVKILITDEDGEFEGSEDYIVNENNDIIEKTIINFNNEIAEKIRNEFDDKSRLSKSFSIEEDNISYETKFEYDNNDNIIRVEKRNEKQLLVDNVVYEYDEKNRLISQNRLNKFSIKITYDDAENKKTEIHTDAKGNILYNTTTFFDANGNITEEKTPLHTIRYEYEFFE